MKKQSRKQFLRNAALITGAAGLGLSCNTDSETQEQGIQQSAKKYRWKMVTTWSPNFPILGEGVVKMAGWIEKMSGGRIQIQVYGGGELVPAFETFEAVSNGSVEMGHGAAYYWAGKNPATQFFAAIPFGLNAQQMYSWMISGGGLELWEELYAGFNLQPFPSGSTGMQMGGWFQKKIRTTEDLKGVKMRMPGLGGKVLEKAGATPVLSAGGEIYTNLERGVIDAAEWIGPYHDYIMGFHQIARYYYYPGWHEPGPILETIVNKSAYDKLPEDLREIIKTACFRLSQWMLAEFDVKNAEYLQKIKDEGEVEILAFPPEVLNRLKTLAREVMDELGNRDEFTKRVYESLREHANKVGAWSDITERQYYSSIASDALQ